MVSRIQYFCLAFLSCCVFSNALQSQCLSTELAFRSGERLKYRVIYDWGPFWLESAHVEFTVGRGERNGKPVFKFTGSGGTYPGYDWFFKVRDLFTAELDSAEFKPLVFKATMQEGSKDDRHTYIFNSNKRVSYTIITRGAKKTEIDTVKIRDCTMDVLSAIYYARSIDYAKCRVNDTIGMSLLIDGKVYPIYVRYLGRETYTSESLGTFRCIKFSPLLVEGSIFKKGESMKVWVTDDKNRLPLYVETPIIVGKIKVMLAEFAALKYPLMSAAKGR